MTSHNWPGETPIPNTVVFGEIQKRLRDNHPENLEALAQEITRTFAPVVDAMNVALALQIKTFRDPAQFVNQLTCTLELLTERMTILERNQTELSRLVDQHFKAQKILMQELVHRPVSSGNSDGEDFNEKPE